MRSNIAKFLVLIFAIKIIEFIKSFSTLKFLLLVAIIFSMTIDAIKITITIKFDTSPALTMASPTQHSLRTKTSNWSLATTLYSAEVGEATILRTVGSLEKKGSYSEFP